MKNDRVMSDQKRGKGESKRYLTFLHYFVFGVISLVGVNDYFVVVYVSKTDIPKNYACCVTEL